MKGFWKRRKGFPETVKGAAPAEGENARAQREPTTPPRPPADPLTPAQNSLMVSACPVRRSPPAPKLIPPPTVVTSRSTASK